MNNTYKIQTTAELENIKEKFKKNGISLTGFLEAKELFENGHLTEEKVKKIFSKYQPKEQKEIENAQKEEAKKKGAEEKENIFSPQNFSPAQKKEISKAISPKTNISTLKLAQILGKVSAHEKKQNTQYEPPKDINALQKQLKKFLEDDTQVNSEYTRRQQFLAQNQNKPGRQISSPKKKKKGTMFGKVAGATGALLASSYFFT